MTDFSKVKGTDGKISEDNVKAVLEQVIKDVLALKPIQEGRLTLTRNVIQEQPDNLPLHPSAYYICFKACWFNF